MRGGVGSEGRGGAAGGTLRLCSPESWPLTPASGCLRDGVNLERREAGQTKHQLY